MEKDNLQENTAELHFHYKREDRINRAPSIVQDYYDGEGPRVQKGFFKNLFATKGSKYLFASIVILVLMMYFVANVEKIQQKNSINEINFDLSAFSFEETIYITLTASDAEINEDLAITVSFAGINSEQKIVEIANNYSIFDGNESFYRTTFKKCDIIQVDCEVSLDDKTILLQTKVQE